MKKMNPKETERQEKSERWSEEENKGWKMVLENGAM